MPFAPKRPPIRLLALLAGLLVVAALGSALRPAGEESALGSGVLEVSGTAYHFSPTTCTVTDTDFLAAGSGEIDGEDFWISASPDAADLSLGTSSPENRAERDRLWLKSVGVVNWRMVGNAVDAAVVMQDARDAQAPEVTGRLVLNCQPV